MLESCVVIVGLIAGMLGVSRYLRYVLAGRYKSVSDALSPLPFNPEGGQVVIRQCRTITAQEETSGRSTVDFQTLTGDPANPFGPGETSQMLVSLQGGLSVLPDCP